MLERQMEALKDQTNGAEQFVEAAKKAVKQKIRILFKGFGELDDLMCV